MAMRKRSGSGSKRQHKGKLVPIYESFFKGEDLTLAHPNFWNELFLIKPMVSNISCSFIEYQDISNIVQNTIIKGQKHIKVFSGNIALKTLLASRRSH